MSKIYRLFYSVDEDGANCTIYAYPILDEKNTYYIIQSGYSKKHIKKEKIGIIENVDVHYTAYVVFLTDLNKKDEYIKEMANAVKNKALETSRKFRKIYENAHICDYRLIDVEAE